MTVDGLKPVQTTSICCVYKLAEAEANRPEKAGMLENFIVERKAVERYKGLKGKAINRREESEIELLCQGKGKIRN